MRLYRVSRHGGAATELAIARWDFTRPTARLRIRTHLEGSAAAAAARLTVRDGSGHPIVPDQGQVRFDGQNGITFFYSPGTIEVVVPAGAVEVAGVRGLATPLATTRATVGAGETKDIDLELKPVWNPRASGWYAGDHHFHLNYGGPYRLAPDDLLPMAAGEDMDVLTPLLANHLYRLEQVLMFFTSKRLLQHAECMTRKSKQLNYLEI